MDAREACAACRRGFVGGWLLGCRNSAKTASKILKLASEAAQTVRIFEATQISASQESAPLLQSPSTGSTRLTGWFFKAAGRVAAREFDLKCGVEWVHGSWMSRQRCAGRRGGKAEFPCGLMGRGWAEALRCRLGVCRGVSLSAGSVSNCGGIFRWVLRDFLSGVWYGWYIL